MRDNKLSGPLLHFRKKNTLVYTYLEWYGAVCHIQHVIFLIEILIFFENIKSVCLHRYRITEYIEQILYIYI